MKEIRTNDKSFNDIAGYEDEKKYLMEICDFIKNPKKYEKMGAKLPKGLLISGNPGVGKTLFIKALLTEVGLPMYELSKEDAFSDYDIIKGIKDIFKTAKENKPSIIFIDELDRIAIDDQDVHQVNESSRKVLNQLLIEMDGFDNSDGVLVAATANHTAFLGTALLRPGRFDRQIRLFAPNKQERIEILKYYAKDKRLDKNLSLEEIAIRCEGFTGASLETMLNEAAIIAASNNNEFITLKEIEIAKDRIINKGVIKIEKIPEIEKIYRAYHEAGHAVVASNVKGKKVYSISIYNLGDSSGRTSISEDEFERITKEEVEEDLTVLLGGMAGEKVHFGKVSLGSSSDLKNGLSLIRGTILKTGVYGLGQIRRVFTSEIISDKKVEKTEKLEKKIFNKCLKKAIKIIKRNKKQLDLIANSLLKQNILSSTEIENLLEYQQ